MEPLRLPFPPSVNALYRNVPGKGRVKTKQYRAWSDRALWEIKLQKPEQIFGPVEIHMAFEAKGGRRDLDNLCKPVLDALTEMRVIEDDKSAIVRRIILEWSTTEGCEVRINKLD